MTTIEEKEQSIMLSLQKSQELIGRINLTELPAIIDAQVSQINELSVKIEDAIASANDAKDAAEKAGKESAGLGHKKRAIEELQKSGKKSAEAIGETIDALKLSFEYEKQLGEISKFLIALGAFSAEHTRQTVAKLKAEILNKGTGSKLNGVAKKQLVQVIAQLEAQGETIRRQEELEQEIAEQQALLEEKDEQDDRQDIQIAQNAETISAHSQTLTVHQQHNARQDKDIQELQAQDEQQDVLIAENARGISSAHQQLEEQQRASAEHATQIAMLVQEDDQQDALIAQMIEKGAEQDRILSQMVADDDAQDAQISDNRSKNEEQDRILATLSNASAVQTDMLVDIAKKDEEQDERLRLIEQTNTQQGTVLAQGVDKDAEQDTRLSEIDEHDTLQDALIAGVIAKNEEQDARLTEVDATNTKQEDLLQKQVATIEDLKLQIETLKNEKGSKMLMYVTAATAATTLILAILHFFI